MEQNIYDMNKEEFSEWLKNKKYEVGFSKAELARHVDLNPKTISNYLEGLTRPSNVMASIIYNYIESISVFNSFRRMKRADFAKLLSDAIDALNVTQDEISNATRIHQSYISDFKHNVPTRNATTEMQYNIIKYLYSITPDLPSRYDNIRARLVEALNIQDNVIDFSGIYPDPPIEVEYAVQTEIAHIERINHENNVYLTEFSKLHIEIKRLIINNRYVFFMNSSEFNPSDDYDEFNGVLLDYFFLGEFDRKKVLRTLERGFHYTYDPNNPYFFKMITQFHNLISEADKIPNYINKKHKTTKAEEKLNKAFAKAVINQDSDFRLTWNNFLIRLNINSYGWYIIMLFVVAYHYGNVDITVRETMCEAHCKRLGIPFTYRPFFDKLPYY